MNAVGNNLILIAKIVGSKETDQKKLMESFRIVIAQINKIDTSAFLLPMTITGGDAFQCVVTNLSEALKVIIDLEETIIVKLYDLKLGYAMVEREVQTPITSELSYGILGSVSIAARKLLEDMKPGKNRFGIILMDKSLSKVLGNCFTIFQKLVDSWRVDMDYHIVSGFVCGMDYKEVARTLDRERSLIWKREKSLHLSEYFAIKEVIQYLAKHGSSELAEL